MVDGKRTTCLITCNIPCKPISFANIILILILVKQVSSKIIPTHIMYIDTVILACG